MATKLASSAVSITFIILFVLTLVAVISLAVSLYRANNRDCPECKECENCPDCPDCPDCPIKDCSECQTNNCSECPHIVDCIKCKAECPDCQTGAVDCNKCRTSCPECGGGKMIQKELTAFKIKLRQGNPYVEDRYLTIRDGAFYHGGVGEGALFNYKKMGESYILYASYNGQEYKVRSLGFPNNPEPNGITYIQCWPGEVDATADSWLYDGQSFYRPEAIRQTIGGVSELVGYWQLSYTYQHAGSVDNVFALLLTPVSTTAIGTGTYTSPLKVVL
jgi:hypothetical protein